MKRLIRILDTISTISGGFAGVLLAISLILATVEIILRTGFNHTLFVTDEYSGYLMCGLTFCGLSYTLKEKGHIRMTLIHGLMKDRMRSYLDTCCFAIGTIFACCITFYTGDMFWDSVVTRSQSMQLSATYLAIPQFFIPLGTGILTLQFFAELLKSILIIKGDTAGLVILKESDELGR